jgi:N-methylhydantoinase B
MTASNTQALTKEGGLRLDPVTFEVMRHKLDEIVAEAYHTIGRVSGSPVVYEIGDHQEALCTAAGDVVAFGAGVLHWVRSLSAGVKHVLNEYAENPGFEEDDQFMLNDTYVAAVHANDVQLLAPIFWRGELIAWAGCASHHTDVGGVDPGSLCVSATEVFQESFSTPGIKLVERGRVRRDVEATFRSMIRDPDLGVLDLRAKIAANNVVKRRVVEMLDRYGRETVLALFSQLFEYSEQRLRRKLASIPDGTWTAENHIEGIKDPYLSVHVSVTKSGETLTMDFTGSSPQTAGSENIGFLGAMSSAMNPLLTMLCHDLPWNEGLFAPIDFVLPEGSIVNPRRPAAVSTNTPAGANILVMTAAHNALSKMLLTAEQFQDEACGNIGASFNNFVLAGPGRDGTYFATLILDGLAGGVGGSLMADGEDSAQNHWAVKTMISNVETIEMIYPLLYLWRREIRDSGGPGEHRGGLGLESALMPWGTDQIVQVNLGVGQEPRPCLGLAGGYPSIHAPVGLIRGSSVEALFGGGRVPRTLEELGGQKEPGPPKGVSFLGPQDVLYAVVGSGGGGFGDPLRRDPAAVLADIREGSIAEQAAPDVYGVALTGDGDSVDGNATDELRNELRARRLASAVARTSGAEGACRGCREELQRVGTFDLPITAMEPEGLAQPSDRFVLRHTCCLHCAELLDVAVVFSDAAAEGLDAPPS